MMRTEPAKRSTSHRRPQQLRYLGSAQLAAPEGADRPPIGEHLVERWTAGGCGLVEHGRISLTGLGDPGWGVRCRRRIGLGWSVAPTAQDGHQ